jgi:hypothetical protein
LLLLTFFNDFIALISSLQRLSSMIHYRVLERAIRAEMLFNTELRRALSTACGTLIIGLIFVNQRAEDLAVV